MAYHTTETYYSPIFAEPSYPNYIAAFLLCLFLLAWLLAEVSWLEPLLSLFLRHCLGPAWELFLRKCLKPAWDFVLHKTIACVVAILDACAVRPTAPAAESAAQQEEDDPAPDATPDTEPTPEPVPDDSKKDEPAPEQPKPSHTYTGFKKDPPKPWAWECKPAPRELPKSRPLTKEERAEVYRDEYLLRPGVKARLRANDRIKELEATEAHLAETLGGEGRNAAEAQPKEGAFDDNFTEMPLQEQGMASKTPTEEEPSSGSDGVFSKQPEPTQQVADEYPNGIDDKSPENGSQEPGTDSEPSADPAAAEGSNGAFSAQHTPSQDVPAEYPNGTDNDGLEKAPHEQGLTPETSAHQAEAGDGAGVLHAEDEQEQGAPPSYPHGSTDDSAEKPASEPTTGVPASDPPRPMTANYVFINWDLFGQLFAALSIIPSGEEGAAPSTTTTGPASEFFGKLMASKEHNFVLKPSASYLASALADEAPNNPHICGRELFISRQMASGKKVPLQDIVSSVHYAPPVTEANFSPRLREQQAFVQQPAMPNQTILQYNGWNALSAPPTIEPSNTMAAGEQQQQPPDDAMADAPILLNNSQGVPFASLATVPSNIPTAGEQQHDVQEMGMTDAPILQDTAPNAPAAQPISAPSSVQVVGEQQYNQQDAGMAEAPDLPIASQDAPSAQSTPTPSSIFIFGKEQPSSKDSGMAFAPVPAIPFQGAPPTQSMSAPSSGPTDGEQQAESYGGSSSNVPVLSLPVVDAGSTGNEERFDGVDGSGENATSAEPEQNELEHLDEIAVQKRIDKWMTDFHEQVEAISKRTQKMGLKDAWESAVKDTVIQNALATTTRRLDDILDFITQDGHTVDEVKLPYIYWERNGMMGERMDRTMRGLSDAVSVVLFDIGELYNAGKRIVALMKASAWSNAPIAASPTSNTVVSGSSSASNTASRTIAPARTRNMAPGPSGMNFSPAGPAQPPPPAMAVFSGGPTPSNAAPSTPMSSRTSLGQRGRSRLPPRRPVAAPSRGPASARIATMAADGTLLQDSNWSGASTSNARPSQSNVVRTNINPLFDMDEAQAETTMKTWMEQMRAGGKILRAAVQTLNDRRGDESSWGQAAQDTNCRNLAHNVSEQVMWMHGWSRGETTTGDRKKHITNEMTDELGFTDEWFTDLRNLLDRESLISDKTLGAPFTGARRALNTIADHLRLDEDD